eukprot:SAG11_NODE_913_length_6579_cov_3.562963_3_plen_68_part_00
MYQMRSYLRDPICEILERRMSVSVLTSVATEREQLVLLATAFLANPLAVEHFGGSELGSRAGKRCYR